MKSSSPSSAPYAVKRSQTGLFSKHTVTMTYQNMDFKAWIRKPDDDTQAYRFEYFSCEFTDGASSVVS
jgi:hypothetical protein